MRKNGFVCAYFKVSLKFHHNIFGLALPKLHSNCLGTHSQPLHQNFEVFEIFADYQRKFFSWFLQDCILRLEKNTSINVSREHILYWLLSSDFERNKTDVPPPFHVISKF